jgi:hypothetical protein
MRNTAHQKTPENPSNQMTIALRYKRNDSRQALNQTTSDFHPRNPLRQPPLLQNFPVLGNSILLLLSVATSINY